MGELIIFAVVVGCVCVLMGLGYMAGRDKAEQDAYYTVSALEEALRRARLDNERLRAHRDGGR